MAASGRSPWERIRGGNAGAAGPDGAAAPASRKGDASFANGYGDPGVHAALPHAADHRVDGGQHIRSSVAEGFAQRQEPGDVLLPRRIGARIQRRRLPDAHRPGGSAGLAFGSRRFGRAAPAARRGAPGRARLVGFRPHSRRPRSCRTDTERGSANRRIGRERPRVRTSGDRQDRVLQDPGRPAGSAALQRRRIGQRRRRAVPLREASGTPARPAPDGSGPPISPAFRRGRRPGGVFRSAPILRTPGRRLEGVHEPASRTSSGAHAVDLERRPTDLPHPSAPHDVHPGAAPAAAPGPNANLGAAACASRHRSGRRRSARPR